MSIVIVQRIRALETAVEAALKRIEALEAAATAPAPKPTLKLAGKPGPKAA